MEKTETFSLITLYFCCVLGLKARGNSELIEGEATVVCLKKKSFKWRWKVRCGYCGNELQLRPDAGVDAKLDYLEKRKYYPVILLRTIFLISNK